MEEMIRRMSHAFYSMMELASENMPDCDTFCEESEGDYCKECEERYEDALDEFKSAEAAIKAKLGMQ